MERNRRASKLLASNPQTPTMEAEMQASRKISLLILCQDWSALHRNCQDQSFASTKESKPTNQGIPTMNMFSALFQSSAPATSVAQTGDTGNMNIADEKILASLLVMAWVVEARDPYTGGHLWRVSRFSRLLADHAGLPESDAARIAVGGFLHDLGKVGIPDAILCKKDKLTDEEYEVIKTHPEVGKRMLAAHPFSSLVMDAVYMHHETPDGRGYPQGLKATDIPVVARIVGLCDAFDAMTSSRPYRSGMPVEKAMAILRENLGRQFDSEYGEHFLTLADSDALRHIVGHTDEGIPLQTCLMCGPTIVVQRDAKDGDSAYCRSCGGEYRVHGKATQASVTPTGAKGRPSQLEAAPDVGLIQRLVNEAAHDLGSEALLS